LTEKEAPVSLANQGAVPVGTIARQVLGIDKWRNFSRIFIIIDNCVDSEMLVGDKRVVDNILTADM
jgi:hypothetical protein